MQNTCYIRVRTKGKDIECVGEVYKYYLCMIIGVDTINNVLVLYIVYISISYMYGIFLL